MSHTYKDAGRKHCSLPADVRRTDVTVSGFIPGRPGFPDFFILEFPGMKMQ